MITLAQMDNQYEVLEIGLMYPDQHQWTRSMQAKLAMLLPV